MPVPCSRDGKGNLVALISPITDLSYSHWLSQSDHCRVREVFLCDVLVLVLSFDMFGKALRVVPFG